MPGPSELKTPTAPASSNMGSFGYMQNPMMSGAGMPAARPMTPTGQPYKPAQMYQPKPLPAQANPMARSKVPLRG